MKKINYFIPAALLFSGMALSADNNDDPWYAGARLGGTHYSHFSPSSQDIDKDDLGAGVFLGYNISSAFAIETGYTYLGEVDLDNNGTIKEQALDLVGKFTWNTTDKLDLFAKAGGAYYMTDGRNGLLSGSDDDGFAATAGVGVEYAFNNKLSGRVEYQYYHDVELDSYDWNTHFYGLSLVYKWGGAAAMAAPVAAAMMDQQPMAEEQPVVEEQPVMEAQPMVEPQPEAMVEMIDIAPMTVELPFVFDSDELSQSYLDQLAPIAQHLMDYPEAKLYVVGHTDSRGSEAYNQKLSVQRAALIGDYLATHYNIDENRIIEEGRGELEPRATNETKEGRALNRRVSVFTPGLTVEK